MLRAEWTITERQVVLRLVQMKYQCFARSLNAASRTRFSQLQAIIASHISIICRQTGDTFNLLHCQVPALALQQLSDGREEISR